MHMQPFNFEDIKDIPLTYNKIPIVVHFLNKNNRTKLAGDQDNIRIIGITNDINNIDQPIYYYLVHISQCKTNERLMDGIKEVINSGSYHKDKKCYVLIDIQNNLWQAICTSQTLTFGTAGVE